MPVAPEPRPPSGARSRPRSPGGRTREVARRLAETYPEAICELDHRNPFELLVATILSAQTTDVGVNAVTPALFARYPTAGDLAAADPREVEDLIRPTGFYQNKTKSLIGMASGRFTLAQVAVPVAVGIGVGTGVPIVTSTVTALI